MDVQYMRNRTVDHERRVVPDAKNEISVDVSGVARMITLDGKD